MRRVSSLALPAYLASAASTLSLQKDILCECAGSEDTFFLTLVPLEGRQTSSPGRHGRRYFGWFICGSNGKGGRRSSGTFGWAQNRQIFWFGGSSQLLWSGVAWSTQWDSLSVFEGSREKDLRPVWWRERESAFLFQRLSVVIQRFNAILLHDSFEAADHLV